MTYTELLTEVSLLGFDPDPVNQMLLVNSINRALRDLYSSRRIERTVKLYAHGISPVIYHKEICCKNGEQFVVKVTGHSYSMKIHGCGNYMISNGSSFTTHTVESPYEAKLIKGLIKNGSYITFFSNFTFTIYDFSVYNEVLSNRVQDVPDCGPTRIFDLRDMYGNFMAFSSPARDKYGNDLKNCKLYDGKLEIDSSYKGEIVLSYRALPETVEGMDAEIIDIPPEYTHILPLLVTYYLWLNDNEALAKLYKARYDESIALLDSNSYHTVNNDYIDTNGWA